MEVEPPYRPKVKSLTDTHNFSASFTHAHVPAEANLPRRMVPPPPPPPPPEARDRC